GGRKIDNEIELSRLVDGELGGLRPVQNLVDKLGSTPAQVRVVWSVRHQTARLHILTTPKHRSYPRGRCSHADAHQGGEYNRVATDIKCVRVAFERIEGEANIL